MATLSTNDIKIRYVVETANLEAAANAFDKLTAEEKQALAELKRFNSEANNTNKSMGELGSIAGKVGGVLGGLFAVSQIKQFASAVLDTTMKFEAMKKAIDFASGSAEMGNKNFEFIRQTAQKLGLDLRGAVEGYKTFASAANLAGQSSQETNRQFAAVAKAAQVMGLSAEDTKGAFLALGQMMSKGNVQAEELRGQLGERLVGAFGIAAKAMGVTTGELNKMLQKGQVLASDFLPKFATELENTFGKGNVQVTTLAASQNRFNSSIDQLILAIGNKLNPFLKGAYDLAAGIATALTSAAGGGAGAAKKASEEAIAAKRVETELTKGLIELDKQGLMVKVMVNGKEEERRFKITKDNIENLRRQIARNQLLGIEERISNQMQKVFEARVAAAGTMNSRLQMNLTKQEKELKVLQEMEQQYIKIAGVIVNTPPPAPVIDEKERVKILKEQYDNRLNLLELEKQQLILLAQLRGSKAGEVGAEKIFAEKVFALKKEYSKKNIGITQQEVEVARLSTKVKIQEFERASAAELMVNKTNLEVFKQNRDEIENRLKIDHDAGIARMKDWSKKYEESLKEQEKALEESEKNKQAIREKAIELASVLVNGAFNLYQANLSNEMTLLQKRYDQEIKLADGNQQKIDELNQRKAEKEKEINIKQFKAQQAAAIANIIFELGQQLVKYSSNPLTAPLAALSAGIAAAQIGFIMAQPVPEFAEGTKGKPFKGGKAIVGERGVEKVVTESGKVYFTPPTATLVDLPKGSQVIPNHALSRQELFLANHYASRSSSTASPVVGEIRELGSILKGLPITQLSMDERGFEKYIRTPRRSTKILNNRFGIKN